MKRLILRFLLLCILLSSAIYLSAQKPWQYSKIEDAIGKEVWVTDVGDKINYLVYKTAYISDYSGEFVKFKKKNDTLQLEDVYVIKGTYANKNQQLLLFHGTRHDLYIPIETTRKMLGSLISKYYCDSLLSDVINSGTYIDKYKYEERGLQTPIKSWNESKWPQIIILGNSYYKLPWRGYQLSGNNNYPIDFKTSNNILLSYKDYLALVPCLLTENDIQNLMAEEERIRQEEERRKEEERKRQEALQRKLDSIRDNNLFFAHVKYGKALINDDEIEDIKPEDTLLVYYYTITDSNYIGRKEQYLAIYNGNEVELTASDYVLFYDQADKGFLLRRGSKGMETRKKAALRYDSIRFERVMDRFKVIMQKLDSIQTIWCNNKTFLLSLDYAYSDYEFGLEFEFFNCFSKTIKYIDITVVAYNQVDDPQRDYFGRTTQKIHCIGPIAPLETGTYTFDEMFWDEYDVIRYLRPTYIKFTFKDNTVKTYSGWNNIKKHLR